MAEKTSLIDKVFLAVEKVGMCKVDEALSALIAPSVSFDDERVQEILTVISEKMDIPIHEIIYGVGRKNERKMAIGFGSHYLESILKIPPDEITKYLNKHISICYRYSKKVRQLNPSHLADQKFCEIKQELDNCFKKMKTPK